MPGPCWGQPEQALRPGTLQVNGMPSPDCLLARRSVGRSRSALCLLCLLCFSPRHHGDHDRVLGQGSQGVSPLRGGAFPNARVVAARESETTRIARARTAAARRDSENPRAFLILHPCPGPPRVPTPARQDPNASPSAETHPAGPRPSTRLEELPPRPSPSLRRRPTHHKTGTKPRRSS